jgi:hypothetical protein
MSLHQSPERGPSGGLQARLLAPSMGLWAQLATGAVAMEQLFYKRLADAEQRGNSPLRAELSGTGVHDLLAEVSAVSSHIHKLTPSPPYIQVKTAVEAV